MTFTNHQIIHSTTNNNNTQNELIEALLKEIPPFVKEITILNTTNNNKVNKQDILIHVITKEEMKLEVILLPGNGGFYTQDEVFESMNAILMKYSPTFRIEFVAAIEQRLQQRLQQQQTQQ
jgi:hypothetical protein